MITHIRTKNFKGLDLNEDVPQKIIYSGPNRSGKTAHSENIAIVLYGYVPWSIAGKRPSDVLDSFGDGKELVCAATIGKVEFARRFFRKEDGSVSQTLQTTENKKKKTGSDNFKIMLDRAGAPKIANVAEFMSQSEAKKVETLFELFPNPELANIDQEIETAKEDVSRIDKKIKILDGTIQRLADSKNDYHLPAGSLPEIQAEIKSTVAKIADIENQIKQAEIEEAEQKAAETARKQEQERIENERHEEEMKAEAYQAERFPPYHESDGMQLKSEEEWENSGLDSMPDSPKMDEIDRTITGMEQQVDDFKAGGMWEDHEFPPVDNPKSGDFTQINQVTAKNSITRIIDAMTQTGCTTCAALIVAKKELKKYEN